MSGEEILEILKMLIVFVAAMMVSYAVATVIRNLFNKKK